MFREVRRSERELSRKESEGILENASFGTLAVNGDDGYPYAIPISYVFVDDKIYFHGANAGYKYEALKKNNKVSFTAVTKDSVDPAAFTTKYASVVLFGKVNILEGGEEFIEAGMKIARKYSPDHLEGAMKYINASSGGFAVYEIEIDHMSGKSNEKR